MTKPELARECRILRHAIHVLLDGHADLERYLASDKFTADWPANYWVCPTDVTLRLSESVREMYRGLADTGVEL